MKPMMTRPNILLTVAAGLLVTTTGCRAIGDIFKAGMWVGVVVAVLVVGLIGGIIAAFRR
jgi:hypothetical protein